MDFTGSRKQEQSVEGRSNNNEEYIVKSKQSIIVKIFTTIFTLIMWLYSIVVFYFFLSAIINYNDNFIGALKTSLKVTNTDIRKFMLISVLFFVLSFLVLYIWRTYNKQRFGSLNRRSEPEKSTDEDILRLQLITPEDYKILKNEKIIIFEKNPVKDLDNNRSE